MLNQESPPSITAAAAVHRNISSGITKPVRPLLSTSCPVTPVHHFHVPAVAFAEEHCPNPLTASHGRKLQIYKCIQLPHMLNTSRLCIPSLLFLHFRILHREKTPIPPSTPSTAPTMTTAMAAPIATHATRQMMTMVSYEQPEFQHERSQTDGQG